VEGLVEWGKMRNFVGNFPSRQEEEPSEELMRRLQE